MVTSPSSSGEPIREIGDTILDEEFSRLLETWSKQARDASARARARGKISQRIRGLQKKALNIVTKEHNKARDEWEKRNLGKTPGKHDIPTIATPRARKYWKMHWKLGSMAQQVRSQRATDERPVLAKLRKRFRRLL